MFRSKGQRAKSDNNVTNKDSGIELDLITKSIMSKVNDVDIDMKTEKNTLTNAGKRARSTCKPGMMQLSHILRRLTPAKPTSQELSRTNELRMEWRFQREAETVIGGPGAIGEHYNSIFKAFLDVCLLRTLSDQPDSKQGCRGIVSQIFVLFSCKNAWGLYFNHRDRSAIMDKAVDLCYSLFGKISAASCQKKVVYGFVMYLIEEFLSTYGAYPYADRYAKEWLFIVGEVEQIAKKY